MVYINIRRTFNLPRSIYSYIGQSTTKPDYSDTCPFLGNWPSDSAARFRTAAAA